MSNTSKSSFGRTVVALALLGALAATACTATSEVLTPRVLPKPVTFAADVSLGSATDPSPELAKAVQLARRLVSDIGDDATATDALLLAMERGYTTRQFLAAVEQGTLQRDGIISGVEPERSALGRIQLPDKNASAATNDKPRKSPSRRQLEPNELEDYKKGKGLLVEQLRSLAVDGLEFEDPTFVSGFNGTAMILTLAGLGLSAQQIVDVLILGVFFFESDGLCYSRTIPIRVGTPPQQRPCDDGAPPAAADPDEQPEPSNEQTAQEDAPGGAATYVGTLAEPDDPTIAESVIEVSVLPDGSVAGRLTAREEITREILDLCGLIDDDEECPPPRSCPATVLWDSDLSTLSFEGQPPDRGVVSGDIVVTWTTLTTDCIEGGTETNEFAIEATVSPNSATIVTPFTIELQRVAPPG